MPVHRMNRRPSYASVAAGSINRSRLIYSGAVDAGDGGDGTTNSNPLSPTFGETHGDSTPRIPSSHSPEHPVVRLANMQQATQSSRGGQEEASAAIEVAPTHRQHQFGQGWENEQEWEESMALYGRHTTIGPGQDRFVMPAYLYGTRYMQKLVDRQNARDAARREHEASNGYTSHRPSRSPSSTNLSSFKLVPSHRGMTYEVVEARPPENESDVPPLPSRWAEGELEVVALDVRADGTTLRWPGVVTKSGELSAQAEHPMPVECGIYYFEVRIDQCPKGSAVAVGIASAKHDLKKLPGWEPHSWGWHGDDGKKFSDHPEGTIYDKPFGKGDTIGCGIDFRTGTIFFTRMGHRLDDAFRHVKERNLYPVVGFKSSGVVVSTNFGQGAFKYNIADEYKRQKDKVKDEISATTLSSILGGRTDDAYIKELVAQFLRHGGYVETAKAFIGEVQTEHEALGEQTPITGNAAVEDIDAAQRQRIRSAILAGDVDKAIQCTQDFYPDVLETNPIIHFRLKAAKFLEIVRITCSSRSDAVSVTPLKKEKARATLPGASTSNLSASGAMDLDDDHDPPFNPPTATVTPSITWPTESGDDNEGDHMETSTSHLTAGINAANGTAVAVNGALWQLTGDPATDLQTAIMEGQRLNQEYDRDPRREIKDLMRHIKGIWAYEDPTRSKEVGYLFRQEERVKVAEELNGAILVSMGKSSVAAIERLAQQTEVLVEEITGQGLPGAFVNIERDIS